MNTLLLALLPLPLVACASTAPACRAEAGSAEPPRRSAGPVLFVVTAAGQQTLASGETRATGYFLNELYEPWRALREEGYEVVFATPGGRPPPVDPESLSGGYWDDEAMLPEAIAFAEKDPALHAPLTLEEALADAARFSGLVIPGGQGVMVDLLEDPLAHALVLRFGETGRPVGLICHAPALLTRLPDGNPFRGRAVSSVTGLEEFFIESFIMGGKAKDRGIAGQLEDKGFRHDGAFPGRGHAVRDGNLVTSQNPYSGPEFRGLYLEALRDWERGTLLTCR